MKPLFKTVLSKPLFVRVLGALFISGIGTAFTSVAVYTQLTEKHFGPLGFAIAFAAGVLPSIFSSYFAGRYYKTWPLGKTLVIAQLVGLILLLFPLLGSFNGSIWLLLIAEVAASSVSGVLIPVYKTIERSSFSEEELPKLAVLDTFMLTANFICGQGLGSILASVLTLREFLIMDAFSYLLALLILGPLVKKFGVTDAKAESSTDLQSYRKLNPQQRQSLWLIPWLAIVCAPLMVLLPARGIEFEDAKVFGLFYMVPSLLLICSRTIGQLLGPLAAMYTDMAAVAKRRGSLAVALLVYILLYAVAYRTSSLYLAGLCCLLAHIASNIVYSVANYQMMKEFSAEEIGWAFGLAYRFVSLIVGGSGLLAGIMAERFGLHYVLGLSATMWILGAVVFMNKKLKVSHV